MASEIVQRMRWWADKRVAPKSMPTLVTDCKEAADRIEALEAEVARYQQLLDAAIDDYNGAIKGKTTNEMIDAALAATDFANGPVSRKWMKKALTAALAARKNGDPDAKQ